MPISKKLGVSDTIVRTHLQNGMRKLDLHRRPELVVLMHRGELG